MKLKDEGHAIDVLGGSNATGALFRPRLDARVVANWRTRGLPPKAWFVLAPHLRALGFDVSPHLFGMLKPRRADDDDGIGNQG